MNSTIIKQRAREQFSNGASRAEAFQACRDQGVKDESLASIIASLKDDTLCQLYSGRNNFLISITFVQGLLVTFISYYAGLKNGSESALWAAGVAAFLFALFITGFYRCSLRTYVIYICISFYSLFIELGNGDLVSIAVCGLLLGFVWHVKTKLYPFFGLFRAKQINGQYAFLIEESTRNLD